jgi:hypothetical protein
MGGTDVYRAGADGSMSVKCSHSQSFLVFLTVFIYFLFYLLINLNCYYYIQQHLHIVRVKEQSSG